MKTANRLLPARLRGGLVLLCGFMLGWPLAAPSWGQMPTDAAADDAVVKVDPKLPKYEPVAGVAGSIKSVGSDTMSNLMTLWAEGFKKYHPAVQIEVLGKGSSTAPQALIEGAANFGPMSRPLKEDEVTAFEQKFGYKPTQLPTSIDMVAFYVNKDNPLESITLAELDAIFSKTRNRNFGKPLTSWGQLGLEGKWANQPISMYGRNAASGTYGFVKDVVLGGGDYQNAVKAQPGSSAVVQGVAGDLYGIGYSGIGFKTSDVKALAIAKRAGSKPVAANAEHAYDGAYPLSRPLLLTINRKPNTPLDPLRREFVRYVFSQEGQQAVIKDGYYPVNAALAERILKQLGVE